MFFPEEVERALLHNSTDRTIKPTNKPIIKSFTERKVGGGSKDGVSTLKPAKLLHSSSMSGGSGKRKPTAWQTLIKNTMKSKTLNMKEAIKYIKENNLY